MGGAVLGLRLGASCSSVLVYAPPFSLPGGVFGVLDLLFELGGVSDRGQWWGAPQPEASA